MFYSRRDVLAGTAALAGAALSGSYVNAAGQKVLVAVIPSQPATFDPLNQGNHDAMVVSQLIFENLIEVDVNGELRPMLAKALPEISADRLTYTFQLRDDVTFQNGAKFTAADVKYSYDYVLDPANKALRRSYWTPISKVEVVSDYIVRIVLSRPYRPILDYMTKYMGIFPAGSREKHGNDYFQSTPIGIGTGPGIFVESKTGSHVELKRNEKYWRAGTPDWDVVRIEIASEANARLAGLMASKIDVVGAPAARDFLRLRSGNPRITGQSKPALGSSMMMMHNIKAAPFDDLNFRKAVALGVDRRSIADKIYGGLLDPTSVLVPSTSKFFNAEAAKTLDYDPARAKEFLAKSAHANGTSFELIYPADPYLLDVKDAALLVQANLGALGITVQLRPTESGKLLTDVIKGSHQSALWAVVGPLDPTFIMQSCYTPDQTLAKGTGYNNEKLTQLIKDSHAALTDDELKPIMAATQTILAEDAPSTWIGTAHAFNLWNKKVSGFEVNSGITLNLRDVKLSA
jgi:peptide/nickel transport system substrate-binding protein